VPLTVIDLDSHLPAIADGDTAAFGRWMAGAEATVRASLRGFAARVDTESVVQETLLRVWQVAPRIQRDGKPNSLLRLALRIARNLAISETRRLRTADNYTDDLGQRVAAQIEQRGPTPPDPMLRAAIQDCRDQLPDRPAQALQARLGSGGRHPDTALAADLGMKKNTFLQNVTRARKLLAQCLESRGVHLAAEYQ
jgi:RNA polymerase sigma-70 factor (ECF subfamily)